MFAIFSIGISAWFGQSVAQKTQYTLHGTIKDPKGAVIAGLRIMTEASEPQRFTATDINGDFKIDLPIGDHVLIVNSPELYDFRAFIKITGNGLNPDNVEFVVDPSRVCCSTSSGEPFAKPTSLPRPAYPAAARAVRAGGEVVVQLMISGDGKVFSAKAMNGHPLLRAMSESAARGARFELSEQKEREVKLVYVYIPDAENLRIGTTRYTTPYRIEMIGSHIDLVPLG